MSTTDERKQRTITLTGRPPVRIYEDEWPEIASSSYRDHDGEVEAQANEAVTVRLRVRQHADGRVIVYGSYDLATYRSYPLADARAGVLIQPNADIPAAIREVCETLQAYELPEAWQPEWRALADKCIADLPAEQI